MLKPMDIHNKEFKKAMRGYDAEEVDEFLDEIIVDFEKLQRELDVLKTQLSNYSENMNSYREKEISLNNTLVSAQRFADQLIKDAETKAANIVAEAEAEAARIIGGTEAKYNKVLADYTMLATRYNDAKETLKDYFQNQIAMLDKEEYIIYLVLFYIFQIQLKLCHKLFHVIFFQHLLIYLNHLPTKIYQFFLPNLPLS